MCGKSLASDRCLMNGSWTDHIAFCVTLIFTWWNYFSEGEKQFPLKAPKNFFIFSLLASFIVYPDCILKWFPTVVFFFSFFSLKRKVLSKKAQRTSPEWNYTRDTVIWLWGEMKGTHCSQDSKALHPTILFPVESHRLHLPVNSRMIEKRWWPENKNQRRLHKNFSDTEPYQKGEAQRTAPQGKRLSILVSRPNHVGWRDSLVGSKAC